MSPCLKNLLEEAKQSQNLLAFSIHTQASRNDFFVGRVISYTHEILTIEPIDKNGLTNGIEIFRIDGIYHVEIRSQYLERLDKINASQYYAVDKEIVNITSVVEALNFIFKKKILSTFHFGEDFELRGIINLFDSDKFDNPMILLRSFDEYGKYDGESCFYIDNITSISFEGRSERYITSLALELF